MIAARAVQPSTSFSLSPRGPYSLAASSRFLCAFKPLERACGVDGERLRFAFPLDGTHAPVAVSLRQVGGRIEGAAVGTTDAETVSRQVARILSLDHDGEGYARLGEADPQLGEVQRRKDYLRPVVFFSPYVAAAWGVLSQRVRMPVAAALRQRLSEELGATLEIEGEALAAFPGPEALLALKQFPGLPEEKLLRLKAIASAELDGLLDPVKLRALGREAALEQLQAIRGVGPWTAEHILLRGCGTPDEPSFSEPRVRRAVQLAYQLDHEPTDAELEELSDGWRPYRTWVCVLLVATFGGAVFRSRR